MQAPMTATQPGDDGIAAAAAARGTLGQGDALSMLDAFLVRPAYLLPRRGRAGYLPVLGGPHEGAPGG